MTTKKLVIVHAGMSETSSTAMLVGRIASAVAKAGVEHGVEIATRVVSVRELLPELPAALGSQHFGPGFSSAIDALREADALVVELQGLRDIAEEKRDEVQALVSV